MSNQFNDVKKEILKRAKSQSACSDQYRLAANSKDEKELLDVIKNNLEWCSNNGVIDQDLMKLFTPEIYYESGIANSGSDNTGFANTGSWNTGYRNTGDRNTGSWNTGDRNTGYSNTGDRNTGDRNTGYSNTGDRNTGYSNTGDRNTGSWNTGDRNTGYRNTGSWNTGDRNTGYSNTGDRNAGVFCTGEKYIKFFNKESDWTEKDFLNSKAYLLLCDVNTKMWIDESVMTDEEKEKYPSHKACGGYLKDIPFKEAFTNKWHNWSEANRKVFTTLPYFDAEIFEQITGVKL
jgi:hypothetical protein